MPKNKNGLVFLFQDLRSLKFQDDQEDEEGYKPIPIFREGKFEHPWYGNLDFNKSYLQDIVSNHENGVVPTEISFDQSHNPDLGALAWVKPGKGGLYVEDITYKNSLGKEVTKPFLFAMIRLTKLGKQKIEDEEFKYFSSEINPDYSTREVIELEGPDTEGFGTVSHGPVLIGGGFTNRPFIPNLGAAFSEDGQPLEDDQIHTLKRNDDKTFFFSDASKFKNPVPVLDEAVEEVETNSIELTEPIGENRMKFSDVIAQLEKFSTPAEKVKYLEGVLPELGDDSVIAESYLKTQREAAQFSQQAAEAAHKAQLAEKRVAQLDEQVTGLSNDLLASKEIGYQEKVKAFSASVRADGHGEAVVKVVEEILAGVKPDDRAMNFSTLSKTGETESFDLFEAFNKVFKALPEASKVIEEPALDGADDDIVEVAPEQAQEFNQPPPEEDAQAKEEASRVEKYTQLFGAPPHENVIPFLAADGNIDMDLLNNFERNQ